jgi:4,5-DOPA dioxygenase extradiol
MQRNPTAAAYDWANEFNDYARDRILSREHESLIHYERAGKMAQLSIPTPEHYLPLLYILGVQHADEAATIVCDGIDLASISMLSVRVG